MTAAPARRGRRSGLGYRPALDGVRGTAMVMFMAFHFGATWLPGAWVGINLFFVLSAFLITRLLVQERVRYGDIDALAFYRRRARRLLPALFLLLVTLCVYGLTLADPLIRKALRTDLLATLFYVQNWHLVAIDDQYFQAFNPSLLRHAWTLAVEEQFYVVVPLLLAALLVLVRRRAVQVAAVLALGALSALWTAHIGVASPSAQSHVYYGTDTRAQALCIGAALGLWLAPTPDGRPRRPLSPSVLAVLGWGGLAAMCYAYLQVEPFAPWMFDDGGMFLFALASAALVLACADRRSSLLNRVLGWRPFAYLGKLSYSLYLWHWPIHLWLEHAIPDSPGLVQFVIGMAATIGVSALSYRYLERPVIQGGVRALLPRLRTGRALVTGMVALVVAGAFVVGSGPSPRAIAKEAAARHIPLVKGQPTYHPHDQVTRVGLLGDSVPKYLVDRFPADRYSDLRMVNLGVPGCDLMNLPMKMTESRLQPNGADCAALKDHLTTTLRDQRVDVLVIFWGSLVPVTHKTPNGKIVSLSDPAYRHRVVHRLNQIRDKAQRAGVHQVQIVTVPCRSEDFSDYGDDIKPLEHQPQRVLDELVDPTVTNRLFRRWAGRHDVPVIDLYRQLCANGYQPRVHGIRLYDDSVHFGTEASPMVWTWLAPQIRSAYEQRKTTSTPSAGADR